MCPKWLTIPQSGHDRPLLRCHANHCENVDVPKGHEAPNSHPPRLEGTLTAAKILVPLPEDPWFHLGTLCGPREGQTRRPR